jgi:dUTPase
MAGVVDSDYRGEVVGLLYNLGGNDLATQPADCFAQLIVMMSKSLLVTDLKTDLSVFAV